MVCSRGQYEAKLSKRIRGNITKITGGRKAAHISTALLLCTVQYLCFKVFSPVFYHQNFIYNPNISPKEEYYRRLDELHSLLKQMQLEQEIEVIETEYHPEQFYHCAGGLEHEPEGGERCKML